MARDRYTVSALHDSGNWTPMVDVPRGHHPMTFAEEQIAEHPTIKEVSIYRNSRYVRSARRDPTPTHSLDNDAVLRTDSDHITPR